MAHTLYQQSELVAKDVHPNVNPDSPEEPQAGSFIDTLTVILTTLMELFQNCPMQQPEKIREAVRKPNAFQRAALLVKLRENCECCGMSGTTNARLLINQMRQRILDRAKMLTDEEIDALVAETRKDPLDLQLI